MDSLTATGSSPGSSRPQSSLHQSVNISRDSGLSEPHPHGEEVTSNDSARSTAMQRCLSHSEDTEDDGPHPTAPGFAAQSVDNLTMMHAQRRTARIVSDPDANAHDKATLQGRQENVAAPGESGLHRQQVNVDSTDSVYESAESNASLAEYRQSIAASFRSSKRTPAALLTRSASGDHLYLTERIHADDEPSLSTALVAQELRQSRRRRSPADGESDAATQSPLTVSMTAGDSTYGSSPVSPESNDSNASVGGRLSVENPRSSDASPSPQPFMTRNSAYRKPARHRKSNAAQAPSPTNVCVDDDEEDADEASDEKGFDRMAQSTDASNDDEADSGVHVMEVHTARPIIISCNCESSSSVSSDDEKMMIQSERKSSVLARPPTANATPSSAYLQPSAAPSSSMISEIYPLKSPSQRTWPSGATRFIVDSTPTPTKPDPSVVIRRHSTRAYPTVGASGGDNSARHSYDEGTLTERVYRGLELMMEKVENAHISQEKLLRSRLSDSVNDSSTVTETSSEESTPHVSRESSSAQDYKQVARVMFDRSNLDISKSDGAFHYAGPRSYQTLPMSRSVTKSDGSAHPMPSTGRSVAPSQSVMPTVSRIGPSSIASDIISEERKPYSQYNGDLSHYYNSSSASLPRYRAGVVSQNDRSSTAYSTQPRYSDGGALIGSVPLSSFKNETTPSTAPESIERLIPVRVVPVVPGQVRDRVQRYDRERLRRKTLGGVEFTTLAQLARNQTPVTTTIVPTVVAAAPKPQPQPAERVTRYDQQRSGGTAASLRNRFARMPHSQLSRSTSLDRRTIDLREEERQKNLANAEDEERRRQDISWSVRQYVKLFDSGARNESASGSHRPSDEKHLTAQQPSGVGHRGGTMPYPLTRQISSEAPDHRRPISGTRGFPAPMPLIGSQTTKPYSTTNGFGKPVQAIMQKQNGLGSQNRQSKVEPGRRPGARRNERSSNSESYV